MSFEPLRLAALVDPCSADWHTMPSLSDNVRQCHQCERNVVDVQTGADYAYAFYSGSCVSVERSLFVKPFPLDGPFPTTRGVIYDPPEKEDGQND